MGSNCFNCGEKEYACAMCGETLHVCGQVVAPQEVEEKLPKGFRRIPDFPTYMINRQGTVKQIETGRLALFARIANTGAAMIIIRIDDKKYTKAAQELREQAFPEG